MAWLNLRVFLQADRAEALSDALLEAGALAVSLEDAAAGERDETPIFGEPSEPDAGLWTRCALSALLESDADPAAVLNAAAQAAGVADLPAYAVESVADADWVRLTQAQFSPIEVSRRLWIVPTWHAVPRGDVLALRLDPGLAFGTGSHPTTRLCLRWLDDHIRGGETLLDYGCGSGILAIAAKMLGAGRVWGVDIDPHAVEAARANALQNSAEASFYLPDEAPAEPAQVVLANILTNPLKALAPLLARLTEPGGSLVLSGILDSQAEEVMAVYAPWFEFTPPAFDEGWTRLWGRRT